MAGMTLPSARACGVGSRSLCLSDQTLSLVSLFRLSLLLLTLVPPIVHSLQLTESHRLAEYLRRNHTYLPRHWVPSTPGWEALHVRRVEQVRRIQDDGKRYEGWLQSVTSGFVSPNFTEFGWGLARAPPDIVEELKQRLHEGLPTAGIEGNVDSIGGDLPPLMVDIGQLSFTTLDVLRPMHEEWAGVPLKGAIAYGLRAYRNGSNLLMHVDKPLTHIISCILHVDHSEDSEPWPIFIEDFTGRTNEVVLESGDMLFYESSKCLHGRPRNFKGSWYSSILVHYHPIGWDTETRNLEGNYAIPPDWVKASTTPPNGDHLPKLQMVGTALEEPDCPDVWCNTRDTTKWFGPAPEGVVVTVGYDPDDPMTWQTAGAHARKGNADDGHKEL